MNPDMVALIALRRELKVLTGASAPGYRRIYTLAIDGIIPATQGDNGRWYVARADISAIAASLGMAVPAAANPTPRRRKALAEQHATA